MRITPTITPTLLLASTLTLTAGLTGACLTGDDELGDDVELGSIEEEVSGGSIISNAAGVGAVQLKHGGGGLFCSGTMIAPDWVLTAAHCATSATADYVRLGNDNDPYAQISSIERVVNNPAMDLALVRLRKAFDVQNRGPHYKLSLFSDPTKTLMGKLARFYGSSNDPACGGGNCAAGYVRSAFVGINLWGSHNLGGSSSAASVPGDSGGGLVYETSAGRELAGVNKAGFASGLVRPDAFRSWALATIYDRPIDLPDIWNYGANSGHFYAVPLQDNYDATATWDPCPNSGTDWNYTTSYELEANRDTLTVSSLIGSQTHTGNYTSGGRGRGVMTLRLRTDGSNRSKGITRFTVTCNRGVDFPNPWGTQAPAGTNDLEMWDPCPGGNPWKWTAGHSYAAGTNGMIGSRVLTGTAISSGTVTGETFVATYTPTVTSGLLKTIAQCQLSLQCHGNTCFSRADINGGPQSANVSWNPCNGGGFRYKATLGLGAGDAFRVNGGTTNESYQVNGSYHGTTAWRTAGGTVNLNLAANTFSQSHVKELVAQCDAWGADRTSVVQVQSATYGRNCRVNKDNVSQKVWESCRSQGGRRCTYVVNTSVLGDPAYGCAKDFTAEWTCGTSTGLNRLVISGEANGRTAILDCP